MFFCVLSWLGWLMLYCVLSWFGWLMLCCVLSWFGWLMLYCVLSWFGWLMLCCVLSWFGWLMLYCVLSWFGWLMLCCVLSWLAVNSGQPILPISFRVILLALGQSYIRCIYVLWDVLAFGIIIREFGDFLHGIMIWGLCCQKVSQAEISNYIPQYTAGCNYLFLPKIPASGNKVLIYPNIHCSITCDLTIYQISVQGIHL